MKTKSGKDTWVAASTTGPVVGTCSSPSDRVVTCSARSATWPSAIVAAYHGSHLLT